MAKKPRTEWRVVCPNFGTKGHSTHEHSKKDEATCDEAIEQLDRHFDHRAQQATIPGNYEYMRNEIGWGKQKRVISPWEKVR